MRRLCGGRWAGKGRVRGRESYYDLFGFRRLSEPEVQAPPEVLKPLLERFDPFLTQIVAVANGDNAQRAQVEEMLPMLAERGWKLQGAIEAFLGGERNLEVLQRGVDPNSSALIARMVEYAEAP